MASPRLINDLCLKSCVLSIRGVGGALEQLRSERGLTVIQVFQISTAFRSVIISAQGREEEGCVV